MNIRALCLVLTLVGLSQSAETLAQSEALANTCRSRANWFQAMPQFNRDSSLAYYHRAQKLLEKTSPKPEEALMALYAELGDYCFRYDVVDESKQMLDRAWAIAYKQQQRGIRNPDLFYDIRAWQARWELFYGDSKRAMTLLLEAASLVNPDSPRQKAKLLKDQGLFYSQYNNGIWKRVDMGVPQLYQSLALYRSFNKPTDAPAIFDIYRDLASHYNVKEKPDSCDYYYDRMKALLPVLKSPVPANWYYATRGNNLSRRGQYAKARKLIQQSLDLTRTYHLEWSEIYPYSLNLMGVISYKEGRYDEAEEYFVRGRDALPPTAALGSQLAFWEHLTDLNEHRGDYKTALTNLRKYVDERESWLEARSGEGIRQTELKVSLLEKENQITRQQAERQTYITVMVAIGLLTLLLAVVGFGLYRRNRARQRTNQQLATLNTDLAKRNAENELLLKEIHHRVKNNLEVISSLLKLQSAHISDPDVQAAMLASQNRVQSMGILHQKLYQSEHLAFIEMKQYFQKLSENILDAYNATHRVRVDIPMPELPLNVDTAVPIGLIVNELLSNALKYAFPQGQPGRVQLLLEDIGQNGLRLLVADNGVGNTGGVQGTGFGTQLVQLLTRQLEGVLHQEVDHGTRISIQFKRTKF